MKRVRVEIAIKVDYDAPPATTSEDIARLDERVQWNVVAADFGRELEALIAEDPDGRLQTALEHCALFRATGG